ncbi:MAG TPA: Asp-tRNA(Asn)/Glu-tRNA(Gln) amidotransferase subunit GatA [Holophagaceae bacterium]|nr:Asp-tRNA(Asn)/Glu-tRNA(Gln) amidotransferase subunit GatA [Holophagaceae bacterium]
MATLTDWRAELDARSLSAETLAHRSLDRISARDGGLNAILTTAPALTLAAARNADARLEAGERGPLLGIPVVLKDNLNWKGATTTCGSRILQGYTSPYDATVVARLLQAGAVPVAKANMDEFAMGSSGEYSAFGPTRNPWDESCVAGGSSSGSAASVAAGYAPLALGSDTGGSVRLPAAFCGVTALRPTYGVLSRHGVTALASSLDQVGPVAADAAGVAAALSVMAGRDGQDSTSVDLPGRERLWPLRPAELQGLRIGLPREYFGEGLEAEVRKALDEAIEVFKEAGAEPLEVSLPHTEGAIETYFLLVTSEASSNLSRFDGLRYGLRQEGDGTLSSLIGATRDAGFGPEVKRRILLGTFCLSKGHYEDFYLKALKVRTLVAGDFEAAFAKVDVLLTPASPCTAFPFGSRTQDPLAMYLADMYAVGSSLAALPCLALPAGFAPGRTGRPMPVGLQLIGPALSDVRLLELGHAFQQLTDFHTRTPNPSDQGANHGL